MPVQRRRAYPRSIFSNNLTGGNASVTSGTGSAAAPTIAGTTMTVNLAGVTDVQTIGLTVSGVTDVTGQVHPDFTVFVNILAGDINGSKTVSASDIGAVKSQSGVPVTAANFRAEVKVSGTITASDIGLVKSRSGQFVP